MAKKKILTEEEIKIKEIEDKRHRIEQELEHIRYAPEPTYFFNIGNRVEIGSLNNAYISEIFHNGKVYGIDYTHTDKRSYDGFEKTTDEKAVFSWINIKPYEKKNKISLMKNKDLRLSYSQRTLFDLLSKAYYFGINFDPEYQRDYVWNPDDKVALIDSIFSNIDIGKFAFIETGDYLNKMYEILDGKQRINAILEYYEGRFKYKDSYFNDLLKIDQDYFTNYSVNVAQVSNLSQKQILQYFITLNKHGKVMDSHHIEKIENMLEKI